MIRELFYADDVTLLAHSTPDELQQLLDNITLFAKLFGLKVNCAKTKIVVFRTCKKRSPDHLTALEAPHVFMSRLALFSIVVCSK